MAVQVRIQETNKIASIFDTVGEWQSNELPEWFKPLQAILEDSDFTSMTIVVKEVQYDLSLVDRAAQQPKKK